MSCEPCAKKDRQPPEKKTVCGFRVWYYIDGEIKEFKGDSFAEWDAMPEDGFQEANLYENWCADEGHRYQRGLHGQNYYFCVPGPNGLIFGGEFNMTVDEIKAKYTGASVKAGELIPLPVYTDIGKLAESATDF